jgi:hypothetical protein
MNKHEKAIVDRAIDIEFVCGTQVAFVLECECGRANCSDETHDGNGHSTIEDAEAPLAFAEFMRDHDLPKADMVRHVVCLMQECQDRADAMAELSAKCAELEAMVMRVEQAAGLAVWKAEAAE